MYVEVTFALPLCFIIISLMYVEVTLLRMEKYLQTIINQSFLAPTSLWDSNTKACYKLHSKAMINSKGGEGKLYHTQYTLLSNVAQSPFFLILEKAYTHIEVVEMRF